MHLNFVEGATDSPLEKYFLWKTVTKSSVVQHWQIFSCSSIGHSLPFKIRSWLPGDILVVWDIMHFNPLNVVSGDTEIDRSVSSSLFSKCRSSFIPLCINFSMSFNWASTVSHLAFFLWWVDLLFPLWSLLLSRIFPRWLLTAFWVLAGKIIGLWLLAFWDCLLGPVLHDCICFHFRIKRFRVLIKFINTDVEWGFYCCFLCLLGWWFSRRWALGNIFKLIIVKFCWFFAAPYSPFSLFFLRWSRKSLHSFFIPCLRHAAS